MAENNFFPFNNAGGDIFNRSYRNCDHRNPYRDGHRGGGEGGQDCMDCPRGLGSNGNGNGNGNEWQGNRDIHIHNNANTNQSHANANSCVRRDGVGYAGYGYRGCCRCGGRRREYGDYDYHGGERRRGEDGVNLNLNIGCVCAQGTGVGSGSGSGSGGLIGGLAGGGRMRGYDGLGGYGLGRSGYADGNGGGYRGLGLGGYGGCESILTNRLCEGRRGAEYCVCCGQAIRHLGGRGVVCCEVGWRPRFEWRERRRCGLARCLWGRSGRVAEREE